LPHTFSEGQSFYLAYWVRLDRQSGGSRFNVFVSGSGVQSAEKGFEVKGPNIGDGLRWVTAIGQWDSLVANGADTFTVWGGNPSFHLNNVEINDIYEPNVSGYSAANTLQLTYETWHSVVLGIAVSTGTAGRMEIWVNGTKTTDYAGIRTVAGTNRTLQYIEVGGTLCQPDYDCPPHQRKYDRILVTDTWQDVLDGGYLGGGDTTPPTAPSGLGVQ
jgi:hypothetical protein